MPNTTYQLIQQTLAGNSKSAGELVNILSRIFEREAGYSVWRRKGNREDVKDKVNEIFADLFDNDAKALRRYDPQGGASPEWYFKMFARLRLWNYDRAERDRYLEALCEPSTLAPLCVQDGVEEGYLEQMEDGQTLRQIREALSPKDYLLFVDHYILCRPTGTLCQALAITAETLYQRIHRMGRELIKKGLLPKDFSKKKKS